MSLASLEAVETGALWERVVAAMRRAIALGDLAPGTHLKEPLLAQRFGVSRLPVREAIARLEREGLVRVEPRRGAFVVGITEQDVHDMYECRLLLESYAVRRAALQIDPEGIAALQALADQMETAVAANQLPAMAAADMAFHRLLITRSGNRALLSAWEPLAPLIETILTISDTIYSDLPRSIAGHRDIVRALEQRDIPAVQALLQEHLANGERVIHEAISAVREGRRRFDDL
jgi:DNA-binding GntR family transcriptional regulator